VIDLFISICNLIYVFDIRILVDCSQSFLSYSSNFFRLVVKFQSSYSYLSLHSNTQYCFFISLHRFLSFNFNYKKCNFAVSLYHNYQWVKVSLSFTSLSLIARRSLSFTHWFSSTFKGGIEQNQIQHSRVRPLSFT
jgi:hypothetical protein